MWAHECQHLLCAADIVRDNRSTVCLSYMLFNVNKGQISPTVCVHGRVVISGHNLTLVVTPSWCVFHYPEEEKPVVANITVSDVSWDSFLLSWSAEDEAFEAFLIEVTDAETGAEWQNHTAPADVRSLVISGLSPATWYRASLYGVYRGIVLDPVFAETITGISAASTGAPLLASFTLPSSSAHTVCGGNHSLLWLLNWTRLLMELWVAVNCRHTGDLAWLIFTYSDLDQCCWLFHVWKTLWL